MKVANYIQTAIHVLEAGAGHLLVRWLAIGFGVLGLVGYYDVHCYHNFSSPEAMDTAQLARNVAEGRGYTTDFIRPFSLYLVQQHNEAEHRLHPARVDADFARIKGDNHPDIVNPPVYPLIEAGVLKLLPKDPPVTLGRYLPEFVIAVVNQIFLLLTVWASFFMARRLFDTTVAWLTAMLTLGSEPLWQFSVSGLSTNFLLLVFLGIVICLISIEERSRLYHPPIGEMFVKALAAGLLTGVGTLTRYSFGWVIVPVLAYLVLFTGRRRMGYALAAAAAFALLVVPWVVRNLVVSGEPFGAAGFLSAEGLPGFPGSKLEQLLHPTISGVFVPPNYMDKLLANLRPLLLSDLPQLGGSWTGMLFLTGLLMSFRGFAARRMRYFMLFCLVTFMVVEGVDQTWLMKQDGPINGGNLMVLMVPLVVTYAAVFFLQFAGGTHTRGGFLVNFLDKQTVPLGQLRFVMGGLFVFISCLPLIYSLTGDKVRSIAYPPYYPPDLQKVASWMQPDELMMSDVPWAVAWYGRHQTVWLTSNTQDQFYALNDYLRPVHGIFLTAQTMDDKMFSGMLLSTENLWARFALDLMVSRQIPANFPLSHIPPVGLLPSGVFLTDRARWDEKP